jgi:hypothetical protein
MPNDDNKFDLERESLLESIHFNLDLIKNFTGLESAIRPLLHDLPTENLNQLNSTTRIQLKQIAAKRNVNEGTQKPDNKNKTKKN